MDRIVAAASKLEDRATFVRITETGKVVAAGAALAGGASKTRRRKLRSPESAPDDLISWVEAGDRLEVSAKTISRYVAKKLLKVYGPEEKVSSAEVARRKADGSLPLKKKRTTKGGRK
jgi:hypothetical protein